MDEDISKQGALFLQQGRFGKKWKRVWAVLYRDSSCSVSRIEFFEYKDEKTLRKQQEHKKVVRLSDCVRVSEVEMDGCPRNTFPFLLETTDKIFVFATDRQQLDDWTHRLCEIAFPFSVTDLGGKRGSLQRGRRVEDEGMEDNMLYSGRETVCDFRVCVRRTEASDRCRLRGDVMLRAGTDALLLLDRAGDVQFSWPYRFLRRFGRDKTSFSFEAGRRCCSGEGSFEFDTRQGNLLFQAVEGAINLQKTCKRNQDSAHGGSLPPPPPSPGTVPPRATPCLPLPAACVQAAAVYSLVTEGRESSAPSQQQRPPLARLELPVEHALTAVKTLTLDDRRTPPLAGKNVGEFGMRCGLTDTDTGSAPNVQLYSQITVSASPPATASSDPAYSLPFDSLPSLDTTSLKLGLSADPVYDSIDEMKIRNIISLEKCGTAEHIYDEPEGCAAAGRPAPTVSFYDDPEEVRRDAWKLMGSSADPKGHEYPYDPRIDDYAVPKRPQKAIPGTQSTKEAEEGAGLRVEEELKEELLDSPYKNVMIRLM